MTTDVVTVRADMELRDLARLFVERGITGAPVIEDDGTLVGVISQTDLVYHSLTRGDELLDTSHFYDHARFEGARLPSGFQVEDTNAGSVADVMTPVAHTVSERASLETIARKMTTNRVHRLIVTRGRRIVGIISALDVMRAYRLEAQAAQGASGRPSR